MRKDQVMFWKRNVKGMTLAVLTSAVALIGMTAARAQDKEADLRTLIDLQSKQIEQQRQQMEEMKRRLDALTNTAANGTSTVANSTSTVANSRSSSSAAQARQDDEQAPSPATQPDAGFATQGRSSADSWPTLGGVGIDQLIDKFLKANPGAGMPPSVQVGYNNGFVLRSTRDPSYVKWEDQSNVPFELRIRALLQEDYYGYKVTDEKNHLTGVNTGNNTAPDFSTLETKRARLYFDGSAFDPNLTFRLTLDGGTRGFNVAANGNGVTGTGGVPGGNNEGTAGNQARLFQAWIAYDFHFWGTETKCGPDCPDGTYTYRPTLRAIIGKQQPFFCLEEVLGSANEQFVEFSMADWFFDADANNQMEAAGFQLKAFDDRLFGQMLITNGNDNQAAVNLQDSLPGFQVGGWYDLGGTWNAQQNRWDLFGDSISDIDWSPNPVARVGFATNFVPMQRRSQFSDIELNQVNTMNAAPGGSTILTVLNGAGLGTISPAGVSSFALDAVDEYTFDFFAAGKFRGLSIYNEWWLRDLDNFRGMKPLGAATGSPILYTATNAAGGNVTALFPGRIGVIDFGSTVQAGYFLVPKKLEVAGRFSFVSGESGNINGNGTFTTTTVRGVTGPVRVFNDAFREFSTAREYAVGVNYYFYRQLVKWQTDLGWYQGGNPSQRGVSPAGFIAGVDGYMVRSQIQLAF